MGFQSFRGRGGSRGSQSGFRRGCRGGGRSDQFQSGPPEEVVEVGIFAHPCQEDIVCKITSEKIPYSNASVYLENKEEIGKVDEVFGPIKDAYFSIKLSDTLKSKSFQQGVKFFMDPAKFLTLDRILNPNSSRGRGGRGRGRGDQRGSRGGCDALRGRGRGGRGDFRGGRGDFRGGRGDFRGRWSDRGSHGNRGGFRGGRGEINGQRGGERHSFGGKRGASFSASNTPQSKKFKSED
uniref:H/ACA ribonucleoprotein complex subunit n=1 Tax=Schistosoma japonicum TaxID=6182 RepID=C1LKE5_SCHJA|nr:Putative H/ACA ribonucleoprotein complex subunit 1-like protein [Schistosoma japonicum]